MPFELGLDLGCRRFGNSIQREKISLVLDIDEHRYEKFISDVKGQDIIARGSSVAEVIEVVRDWLRNELDPRTVIIPSGESIYVRYTAFSEGAAIGMCKAKVESQETKICRFLICGSNVDRGKSYPMNKSI